MAKTKDLERTWSALSHLGGLVGGFILPFGGWILIPLLIWLFTRQKMAFVDQHGKEAVNFQLSLTIYYLLSLLLSVIVIGIPLLLAIFILEIILVIKATLKASNGEKYRYPMTIRFIK